MNDIVHGGDCFVTDYPIYEALGIWCNPNIIRYDHDLEKAKYYMELAGYTGTIISGFELIDFIYLSFGVIFILVILRRKRSK